MMTGAKSGETEGGQRESSKYRRDPFRYVERRSIMAPMWGCRYTSAEWRLLSTVASVLFSGATVLGTVEYVEFLCAAGMSGHQIWVKMWQAIVIGGLAALWIGCVAVFAIMRLAVLWRAHRAESDQVRTVTK